MFITSILRIEQILQTFDLQEHRFCPTTQVVFFAVPQSIAVDIRSLHIFICRTAISQVSTLESKATHRILAPALLFGAFDSLEVGSLAVVDELEALV